MALETATYISDLVSTNPVGATDTKSQGDDHIRLLKSTVKATFPNVSGAVTATHTEMNYLVGVTSAIQTQFTAKAPLASPTFTGTPAAPTAAGGTNTTQIATTAFVATSFAPLASPTLTGTPAAPTAAPGTNTTQLATTEFVTTAAVAAVVPVTAPDSGKYLTNNGSVVSWGSLSAYATTAAVASTYAPLASPTLTGTPAAPTAAPGTNTTQLATTAFVTGAVGAYVADAIGTYAFARSNIGTTVALGATVAGSTLTSVGTTGGALNSTGGTVLSGTWRCMGYATNADVATLYLRIS